MDLFIALIVTRSSLLICLLTLAVVHTDLFVPFLLRLGRGIIFKNRVFNVVTLVTLPIMFHCRLLQLVCRCCFR